VAHVRQRPVHKSGKLSLLARPRFRERLLEVAARRGQRHAHAFGSRFEALPTRDRNGGLRLAVSQTEGASQRFGGRSGRLVRIVDEEDTAGERAATGFEVRRADGLQRHRNQQQGPPWLDDLKAELLGFPNVKHDDQVDSVTQALTWIARHRQSQTRWVAPIIVTKPRRYFGDPPDNWWLER